MKTRRFSGKKNIFLDLMVLTSTIVKPCDCYREYMSWER